MSTETVLIILVSITLFAAVVNGGLGHGFSSITVPVALLFYTNRVLNPALVLVEIFINSYILFVNWRGLSKVWRRVSPILIGMVPGIIFGSYILSSVQPGWIKFTTFAVLLPLIILQAAGVRRPINSERTVALPFGTSVGILYSVTTVSGPPLALLFNNQGFVKEEFRAALGLIRLTEALMTASAYYFLGLFSAQSGAILLSIAPSVLIGVPLGAYIIHRLNSETFRRLCMSFDTWVVGFGLSRVLIELDLVISPTAYLLWLVVITIDSYLLYRFFTNAKLKLYETQKIGSIQR
jgi:uncharacterized protein